MSARLGRYALGRLLGSGGQGRVYEAVLHGPGGVDKRVALKVLHGGGGLQREARIGGLLRHPNLVDVFEVGEVDGTWFCAMEYCGGGPLSAHLPLPPRAVVEVGLQVCAALAYAHAELGLVHLDLKPENLLLDGATVKVADLGIARADGFGGARRVQGTPGYMAPEQAGGRGVDARADIYALGVVLVQLATGDVPRASATWTVDALPEASLLDGPVAPPWLDPVLSRCLPAEPDARFASMAEVAAALRGLGEVGGAGLAVWLDLPPPEPPPIPSGTHLGPPSDDFVGREAACADLAQRLASPGLVTLKGPGGIGKTRLARQAARSYLERRGAQAWFCDLADARTLSQLLHAVATALAIPPVAGSEQEWVEMLGHAIAARGEPVIVLDSFEQVVEHAAVVQRWRVLAAGARMLVTSQRPLRVDGEQVVEVTPMSGDDAVALLIARARRRGVRLAPAPELAELADRLDGVPLALELAAGRLGVLSPADVLERLRLSFLRSGRAEVEDRHATLRGTLDWSWSLLDDHEQATLAQLSVFGRAGFTLEAFEGVVFLPARAPRPLDVLAGLLDRSLVTARDGRFLLRDAVREYAAEKLPEPGPVEVRHGRWFARLGAPEVLDPRRVGAVDPLHALRAELDNLVAGCRRALAREDAPVAAATACAAWAVFELQGPHDTGVALLEQTLALTALAPEGRARVALNAAQAQFACGRMAEAEAYYRASSAAVPQPDPHLEGAALLGLASLSRLQGRQDEALARCEAALTLFRREGDLPGEALAIRLLGGILSNVGRVEEARAHFDRSVRLHRELGNLRGCGEAQCSLGILHHEQGRLDEALACFEDILAVHRTYGDLRLEARVGGMLGNLHRERGEVEAARRAYDRSLTIYRQLGDRYSEAVQLSNLGGLLRERGRPAEATATLESALAVHRELGLRRSEGITLANIALLHADRGRLEEAAAVLEATVDLHREVDNRRSEATSLCNLGAIRLELGRQAEGLRDVERALATHSELGTRRMEGMAHTHLGTHHLRTGRIEEARACFERARFLHTGVDDATLVALQVGWLGRVALQAGAMADAVASLSEAVAALEARFSFAHAAFLASLGEARVAWGELGQGRRDLDRAARIMREYGWERELAMCLCSRARALEDRAALAAADAIAERFGAAEGSWLALELARTRSHLETARARAEGRPSE